MRTFALLLSLVLSLATLSGCKLTEKNVLRADKNLLTDRHAAIRSTQVKSVDYRLSLDLDKDANQFKGEMVIDFDLVENNRRPLTLDFETGTIERMEINGMPFTSGYRRYFITLPVSYLVPGHNHVVVRYHRPYANNGTGFHRRREQDTGDVYLYSDFQAHNASRMFPAFDQPDLKATFTLDVKAPKQWQLISTTAESKIVELGDKRHWFFNKTPKIATYVFSLHAGPYHVWQDNSGKYPMRLFARQSKADKVNPKLWFDTAAKSLAFYERYFDIPYPFEKYDQIIVPDYNAGAMENVAAVTYNEDEFIVDGPMSKQEKDDLFDTIAHEAAHMWFGDLVTMKWWNGLWLNESFASYMAVLAMERALHLPDAWNTFNGNLKLWGYEADERVTTHPIELPVSDTDMADAIFDGITYGKGAAVVAQLSHFIGESAFRQGIRNYLKKYSYQNTTLENFIEELAKASNLDLTRWSRDWLYHAGINTLYSDVQCDDGLITKAVIHQRPDPISKLLRQHKVKLGFYLLEQGKVVENDVFEVLVDGQSTTIEEAAGHSCPQFVYANVDDWGYLKVELTASAVAFLQDHLMDIDDPGMRLMLWQDLWQNVNHLSLPLSRYITLVERHIAKERNANARVLVYRSLEQAFRWLAQTDNAGSSALKSKIEHIAWQQLTQKDSQLQQTDEALELFSRVAFSSDGLAKVRSLLTDPLQLLNVELSQDERWTLLYLLTRYRFADSAELTAKALKQHPDEQKQQILQLLDPSLKAKETWIDTFVDHPSTVRLDVARTMMKKAFPAEQSKLYEHYQQQLIDALATLNKDTDMLYQSTFARYLIRGSCTAQSVNRLAGAITRYSDAPKAIIDALKVAHQTDQRCYDVTRQLATSDAQASMSEQQR